MKYFFIALAAALLCSCNYMLTSVMVVRTDNHDTVEVHKVPVYKKAGDTVNFYWQKRKNGRLTGIII